MGAFFVIRDLQVPHIAEARGQAGFFLQPGIEIAAVSLDFAIGFCFQ